MRLLLTMVMALAFPILGHAAIAGDWAGVLSFSQNTLRFVIYVWGPDNALRSTGDSPDQGHDWRWCRLDRSLGLTLSLAIQHLDVKFSGDVNSNGTIVGTFVQRGTGMPLVLPDYCSHPSRPSPDFELPAVEAGGKLSESAESRRLTTEPLQTSR
jgi:hypothetical protein